MAKNKKSKGNFVLPDIAFKTRELEQSKAWRIFQGQEKPADKLYILLNIIARDERERYIKNNQPVDTEDAQFSLFATHQNNQDDIATASQKPNEKPVKLKKRKDPMQLSLFDIQQDNHADIMGEPAKDTIKKWQNHILERCAKADKVKSKRRAQNIDYYIAVYGVRKMLGLSQKKKKMHPKERVISHYGDSSFKAATKIQDTVNNKITDLKQDTAIAWLGDVFAHWVNKAQDKYDDAQRNKAAQSAKNGLRYS